METKANIKKHNYKGEIKEIVDFATLPPWSPVEVIEKDVPIVEDAWGRCGGGSLPKLLFIESVGNSNYGPKSRYITYLDYTNLSRKTAYVPSYLKIKRLTGLQSKRMEKKLAEWQIKNIG